MEKEGKYIYCVIDSRQERYFGPLGIGGRKDDVLTIGHENLSLVVSNHQSYFSRLRISYLGR